MKRYVGQIRDLSQRLDSVQATLRPFPDCSSILQLFIDAIDSLITIFI